MNDAGSQCLRVEREGTLTRLVLNRPDKANALDAVLVDALLAAVEHACRDGTRLLWLSGAGRNFCAGFDFTDFETQSDGDLLLRFVRIEQLLQALWHAPIATLVSAHGGCFGAGADLVCACERRLAAPGTRFRMPGLRFGLALGTRRLAARLGAAIARRLLATSVTFDCEQALRHGFIDAVTPVEDWESSVAAVAREAVALDVDARALLHRLTTPDSRDADLADLVRSAAAGDLKTRIRAFRSSTR